jgi:two-component system OmpR family response regulator
MHVLMVEDESLIRELMRDALTDAGFTVSEADDGVTALARFREHGADLLFVDIGLPGSIDGWTLAEQIRSLAPDLQVVFATGKLNVDARQIPNSTFIQKPYAPSTVIREARALLDRARTRSGRGPPGPMRLRNGRHQ